MNLRRAHSPAIAAAKAQRERDAKAKAAAKEREVQRKAREKAATALNVSPRLVQAAKKVIRKGESEVIKAARDGKLAVSVAPAKAASAG